MNAARLLPPAVALSIAAAVVAGGLPSPARAVVVFVFLLLGPGMAFVPLLHVRSWATAIALVVATSLVLDTLVAEAMLLAKLWSPTAGLAIIGALSLVGAALQVVRR